MATGKRVQFARGTREEEDAVTGLLGEIRVDMTRHELRVHDSQKQGGYRIPSMDAIEDLLKGTEESTAGTVQFFATEAELKAFQPSPTVLAILTEAGVEDSFIWKTGNAAIGDIQSDINGHWERLDGQAGLAIMLWRAGMINLQIDGTEPVSGQSTKAWLTGNVLKLWNGVDDYVNATPATWMKLFAAVGGYTTVGFSLPDRLSDILVEVTNIDTLDESGWYKTSSGATGNPVPSVNAVFHQEISAGVAIQRVEVPSDSTKGYYIRYRTNNSPLTWTAFTKVDGVLPGRLLASTAEIANANSATETGFYRLSAGASNSPHAGVVALWVNRKDSSNIAQIAVTTAEEIFVRTAVSGSWSSWVGFSPTTHIHDDRYYTEAEIVSLLAGKANTVHNHDDRYYTESEITTMFGAAPTAGATKSLELKPSLDTKAQCIRAGTYRIHVEVADNTTSGANATTRIYRNGALLGSVNSPSGSTPSYNSFDQDATFSPGDILSIETTVTDPSYTAYVRNFEIRNATRTSGFVPVPSDTPDY